MGLLNKFTTNSEVKLEKSMRNATKLLKNNDLKKQKTLVLRTSKLVNKIKTPTIFDGYSPEKFDELVDYVKKSKSSKKKLLRELLLQNIPKGIIDNIYASIYLDELKYKNVKKLITNINFKQIKLVLKRDLARGFRVFDLQDKLIEKGWSMEFVNKLIKLETDFLTNNSKKIKSKKRISRNRKVLKSK